MQDQFTVGPVEVNEMPAPASRHTEKILLNSGDVIERNRSEETKIRSPEEELILSYKNVLHVPLGFLTMPAGRNGWHSEGRKET